MGECRYCGKKGVFLDVNGRGVCGSCVKELSRYVDDDRQDITQKLLDIGTAVDRPTAIKCCEDALKSIDYFNGAYIKNGVTEAEDMLLKQRGVQAYLNELRLMGDSAYSPRPLKEEGGRESEK